MLIPLAFPLAGQLHEFPLQQVANECPDGTICPLLDSLHCVPRLFPSLGIPAMSSRFLGSAVAVVAMCASVHASVIVTSSQTLWNLRVINGGQTVGTETFNSYPDGYIDGPISGTLGNTFWTASADYGGQGLNVQGGMLSTSNPFITLAFTFSPGVRAVAGNIFGTDYFFNIVPTIVNVTLSDGTAYEGFTTSSSDFIGFYSSTANISSLSITVADPAGVGAVYSTIDNLYLAVPAPGAAALVGLAGLMARRRRA